MHLHQQLPEKELPAFRFNPLIDVVFLLLIFFLLSASFIVEEQHLASRLPEDRELDSLPGLPPPTELIVDLRWENDRTIATATLSRFESGSNRTVNFSSDMNPELGYHTPDFAAVEQYLRNQASELGSDLPVTLHYESEVPIQMVVSVLDICTRLELGDFALAVGNS